MAASDILEHSLGLWMVHYRFATHCLKVVDLFYLPAFGFSIKAGSFFMVFWAFTFGRQYRPLESRLKQIEDRIPELQAEIDFLKIQYLSSDQILQEAKDLYSRWPELTSEEKRKIVENITEKIIVGKDDVTINLCYLPSPSKMMTSRQRNFRDS